MICLIFDLAKGFVPVYAAVRLGLAGTPVFAVIAAAPVLGHAIAPLNGFRGGKCISAIFGTLLGMVKYTPLVFLLAVIYILFSTVVKINPNRRRSIVTAAEFLRRSTAPQFPLRQSCGTADSPAKMTQTQTARRKAPQLRTGGSIYEYQQCGCRRKADEYKG